MHMVVSEEMINRVKTFIEDELDTAECSKTAHLAEESANRAYGALCFLSDCGGAVVEDELEKWWNDTVMQRFINAISKKK